MPDHLHLIWQMQPLIHPQHVQRDFLKYTAQRIKHYLQKNHPELLSAFESDANDRTCQFWKRRALSIELRTDKVYIQKLDYIHWNPVKAGLCKLPEEYKYSSALFYQTGIDNPSASSGRISLSSPRLNYRSVVGGRKHQPRRKKIKESPGFTHEPESCKTVSSDSDRSFSYLKSQLVSHEQGSTTIVSFEQWRKIYLNTGANHILRLVKYFFGQLPSIIGRSC